MSKVDLFSFDIGSVCLKAVRMNNLSWKSTEQIQINWQKDLGIVIVNALDNWHPGIKTASTLLTWKRTYRYIDINVKEILLIIYLYPPYWRRFTDFHNLPSNFYSFKLYFLNGD